MTGQGAHAAHAANGTTPAGVTGPVPGRQLLSVDNTHCHLYGICEQEAPEVFALGEDGRLRYTTRPGPTHALAVRQAARLCPMQAIDLQEKTR